jgi:hypothetical protein
VRGVADQGHPPRGVDRHDFVAFLDGLLFDQVARAGTRKLTSADLRTLIRGLVTAVDAGPARPAA